MSNLNALFDERANLITKATQITAKSKAEGRDTFTAEERAEFDKLLAATDALNAQIETAQRDEEDRRDDAQRSERLRQLTEQNHRARPRQSEPPVNRNTHSNTSQRREDSRDYADWFNAMVRRDFREAGRIEQRAGSPYSVGTDAVGGYLLVPTVVRNELIEKMDEMCEILGMVERVNIGDAKTLGVTKVTARMDDADWTSEVTAVTADTAGAIGRRDLTPVMLTKYLKVSMSLLQRSPDAVPFITRQMARLFGVTLEKALLTGSGSSQPLGIFTASANGISTARDVTSASTTGFTYANLVSLKYSLKTVYHRTARLFLHRDVVAYALKLLDSQNRPIFLPSNQPGVADSILGMPISYSEFCPSTFTAGLYLACWGDPSYIYMADAMQYSLQFADQLYAGTNQVAVYGRMEADASPVLEEAFSRLITAAS